MATPPDARPTRLPRFTLTERIMHWEVVVAFTVMLVTGMILYFPSFASLMSRPVAKDIHLWASIALGIGFVLAAVLGNRRAVLASMREAQYLDKRDLAWLKAGPVAQMGRVAPVPQGRLNAGQKLNTALLSAGMVLMYITGFLLWYGERHTEWRFEGSVPVHDLFTLFLVLLVTGHVYLAIIHPHTRAAMRGMVTGEVDRTYAEHHHAAWVEELDAAAGEPVRETEHEDSPPPAAPRV